MVAAGILEYCPEGRSEGMGPTFKTTQKGSAWVEMICHTPFPVEKTIFVHPDTGKCVDEL
jgi:hypothetical protein